MEHLKILSSQKKESNLAKWMHLRIELPKEPTSPLQCWGIDPGTTNIGIAIIPYITHENYVDLYQISTPRFKNAVDRIINFPKVLGELPLVIQGACRLCIEGASYGSSQFRQVELAEIRSSAVMWAYRLGMDTKIVPPNSIRKCVLGTAKLKAHEMWELIDDSGKVILAPDALAALSCAYYASDCWER